MNKIEELKLEIQAIEQSQETDKFDYYVAVNIYSLLFMFGLTALIALASFKIITITWAITGWIIYFILLTLGLHFRKWKPIRKAFKAKDQLKWKRYKLLGIDKSKLDTELKRYINSTHFNSLR